MRVLETLDFARAKVHLGEQLLEGVRASGQPMTPAQVDVLLVLLHSLSASLEDLGRFLTAR